MQGHEDIIQDLKDSLKDDEALYEAKCGGGGGDGGTGSAPVTPDRPQTSTSNVPSWAKVLGGAIIIGGGLFAPLPSHAAQLQWVLVALAQPVLPYRNN